MPETLETHPRHVVTLVHGVLLSGFRIGRQHWTQPESLLRDLHALKIGDIHIEAFPWSGLNRHAERLDAARALEEKLRLQVDRYPAASHVIVGHSHGGNVALYALRDPALQSRIQRLICVNTPFLFPVRRGMGAVFRGPALLLVLLAASIMIPFARAFLETGMGRPISPLNLVASTVLLAGLVGGFLWSVGRLGWLQKAKARRDGLIASIALPQVRHTTVTCLWAAADEVYEWFQFWDVVANLPYMLMRPLVLLGLFFIAIMAQWLGCMPVFLGREFVPVFGSLIDDYLWAGSRAADAYYFALHLIAYFYSSVLYLITFLLLAELMGLTVHGLLRMSSLGLGALNAFDAHYVRLTVALTPMVGSNLEFEDFDMSPEFSHTGAPRDQAIVERIVELVRESDPVNRRLSQEKKD